MPKNNRTNIRKRHVAILLFTGFGIGCVMTGIAILAVIGL